MLLHKKDVRTIFNTTETLSLRAISNKNLPFFIKMLYSGEWIDDSYRKDVTKCSRLEAELKDFKLTPAEIAVGWIHSEAGCWYSIKGVCHHQYILHFDI